VQVSSSIDNSNSGVDRFVVACNSSPELAKPGRGFNIYSLISVVGSSLEYGNLSKQGKSN